MNKEFSNSFCLLDLWIYWNTFSRNCCNTRVYICNCGGNNWLRRMVCFSCCDPFEICLTFPLPFHPEKRYYLLHTCLLYTSDAADEEDSVDLGGRRIIKKKKKIKIK